MTTLAPGDGRVAVARDVDRAAGPDRTDLRLVSILVVLLVVTQRLGVPVGGGDGVALALPLTYAVVAVLVLRRRIAVAPMRAGLFLVASSACLLATAGASSLGATWQLSMTSLALLLVIYIPWALRVRSPYGPAVVRHAGRTFLRTMLVLSAVSIVQLAAQFLGLWDWDDPLQRMLGAYIPFTYNYNNEVTYGLGIYKSTAFVLLEPSFLSQFCALAILVGIMLRVRAWQLVVLAGGMASSVSGTGILLLAAGGVLLLARAPRRLRPGYLVAGVGGVAAVFLTPVGEYLLLRSDEFSDDDSSANSRFAAPYQEVLEGLYAEPSRFFVGAGAGAVERVIPGRLVGVNGGDVLYSAIPKLAFEYGVLAGGLFALFLVIAMISRAPWRVIPGALVIMIFFLSGALLQPQTAYLAWLLSGIGAADPPGPPGRDPDE